MNYLYISPEFPPNSANFIARLTENGVNVWTIGECDFDQLPESVKKATKWHVKTNMYNFDELRNVVNYLQHDHVIPSTGHGFDIVGSHNEHWLRVEAFINEMLNLPGINYKTVEKIKKKSWMKEFFKKNHIQHAPGRVVHNLDDALGLAYEIGYPVILKPDEGVGAVGTYKIENEEHLRYIWPQLHREYILEKFINGQIVTYDGMVDWEGNVVFENSLRYECGVMENIQNDKDQFFYSTRHIPETLRNLGKQLVNIFDLRHQFFHFEFFENYDGYTPIEINARPPGGKILDMMNYSSDVDLYDVYAKMINKSHIELGNEKRYFSAYIGRRDKNYIHNNDEIMSQYGHYVTENLINSPLYWQAMGKYVYLVRAEDESKIYEIKDFVLHT